MLISWRQQALPAIKTEPEDDSDDKKKAPSLQLDDYDVCAACKSHFKGYRPPEPEPEPVPPPAPFEAPQQALVDGDEAMPLADGEERPQEPQLQPPPPPVAEELPERRRGQQPTPETLGLGRKVKEFYSYNTISGELLHVTALQAILSVFELRMIKSASGFDFDEANENLGFCQNCGTLISQLYKLHQEVADIIQTGSNVSRMLEFEELLTDTQEADPSSLKRRRVGKAASKVNGVSLMEEMDHEANGTSWMGGGGGEDMDTSWNDDGHHDDAFDTNSYDNDSGADAEEVNIKPRIHRERTVGIKITSVGTARTSTLMGEDMSDDGNDGDSPSRRRRSSCKKVDYAKVLQGPVIDGLEDEGDDDEYRPEPVHHGRGATKSTARKKTTPAPPSTPKKPRGRPPKASKPVVVPPTKQRQKDPHFKLPAEKTSREATCQVCRKVFPSHYLAEHMNVAHNAVLGQPCLICGKFFESSYKAIKHLLTHVPEKAFGCSRCHATFKTAEDRNTHTNTHTEAEKKLECPKCAQPFTSLLLMNKHEAQKHRQTKSFLCSICAKLLTGKDEWIQHILSHGPFQCYYCRDFLQPGEYKRHVQSVHMNAAGRHRQSSSAAGSGVPSVIAEVTLD